MRLNRVGRITIIVTLLLVLGVLYYGPTEQDLEVFGERPVVLTRPDDGRRVELATGVGVAGVLGVCLLGVERKK